MIPEEVVGATRSHSSVAEILALSHDPSALLDKARELGEAGRMSEAGYACLVAVNSGFPLAVAPALEFASKGHLAWPIGDAARTVDHMVGKGLFDGHPKELLAAELYMGQMFASGPVTFAKQQLDEAGAVALWMDMRSRQYAARGTEVMTDVAKSLAADAAQYWKSSAASELNPLVGVLMGNEPLAPVGEPVRFGRDL